MKLFVARNIPRPSDGNTIARFAGALALSVAALLMIVPSVAGAADNAPEDGGEAQSAITITQDDSAVQEGCLPSFLVLSRQVNNTSEFFELTVRASAAPCDPINAKAVIYAMPGNGVAWPQTLVEVKEFTISKAGTTSIRFDKTCDPQQFDVITGAAPEVISPEGEHHGPLLFPLDTETALQHWGCDDSTTSTSSTTTTEVGPTSSITTPPSSVTTVPVSVAPTSEVAPTSVLGTQVENTQTAEVAGTSESNTEVKDTKLAYTGANSGGITLTGVTLALLGAVLLVVSKRRERTA